VAAVVSHGSLRSLTGDEAGNQIVIVGQGVGYLVVGIGTTINGSTSPLPVLSLGDANHDLVMNLNGGNDMLTISKGTVGRSLNISLGDGNDLLTLQKLTVKGDLNIDGGEGNNAIAITSVVVGANGTSGNLTINTGAGTDVANLSNVNVRSQLNVNLGDGDDSLSIANSTAASASLEGGAGANDRLSQVNNHFGNVTLDGWEITSPTVHP
jgi:hypothetical protein